MSTRRRGGHPPGPIPSPSNLPQGHFPPSPLLIAADKQWLDYYRHNPIFYELWTFAYAQNPVCLDAYKEARRAFEDLNQRIYGDPSHHQTASHDGHATTRVSVSPTSPLPPPAAAWSDDQDSVPTEANPADTDAHMESGPTVSDLVHEGVSEVLQVIDGLWVSSLSSDAVDSLRSLALALHTFLGADHPTSLSGLTMQPLAQCMQPVPPNPPPRPPRSPDRPPPHRPVDQLVKCKPLPPQKPSYAKVTASPPKPSKTAALRRSCIKQGTKAMKVVLRFPSLNDAPSISQLWGTLAEFQPAPNLIEATLRGDYIFTFDHVLCYVRSRSVNSKLTGTVGSSREVRH